MNLDSSFRSRPLRFSKP